LTFWHQVYIEALDFKEKVEGWVNCDELELTTSRDGISTDENTAYPEFMKKDWEEVASQAILKYSISIMDYLTEYLRNNAE
jgi:hypothetical protein